MRRRSRLAARLIVALGWAVVLLVGVRGGTAWAEQEGGSDGEIATRSVVIDAGPFDDLGRPVVVDRLAPQTVLTVRAVGFDPDTTGRVEQCVDGSRCRNALAVRTDDDGLAVFQYLVTDDVDATAGSSPCRLGGSRCTIELGVGDTTQVVDTVFVDAAPPPGVLSADPSGGLRVGDTSRLSTDGFVPGAELTVLLCAGPATSGPRCGRPGPVVPLTIGADGSAETTFVVPAEVGADRVACGRQAPCQVVVSSDDVGVWAPPLTLRFAGAPGPDYDPTRLAVGLALTLGLAAVALWLIRSTDWSPPPEADSSPIDDAEYADLDLEAEQSVDEAVSEEALGAG